MDITNDQQQWTNEENKMNIENFFLTPEEYFQKRASIIEELKKVDIDIQYKNEHNYVCQKYKEDGKKEDNKYTINIQTPEDPHVDKKSAVYHELSHVLWDSFVSGSLQIMRDWAEVKLDDLLEAKKIPKAQNINPNATAQEIINHTVEAQNAVKNYISNVYKRTFNALEDQRIESLTRNVWLATGDMFNTIRHNCGEDMTAQDIKTPVDHVLSARFFRPELTTQEYIDAVNDVEGTDKYGAIRVMQVLKETIDKHIEENLKGVLDNMKKVINGTKGLGATPQEIEGEKRRQQSLNTGQQNTKAYKSRVERYAEAIKSSEMSEEQKKEINSKIKKYEGFIKSNEKIIPKAVSTEVQKRAQKAIKKEESIKKGAQALANEGSEAETQSNKKKSGESAHEKLQEFNPSTAHERRAAQSGTVEESKSAGNKEVIAIVEKLTGNATPRKPAHIVEGEVGRDIGTTTPDIQASTQLSKIFNKIKQSKRQKITEQGSEIDIESLISSEEKGYGDFMIDEVKHRGLTVLVSIDGSGSMRHNYHITQARNLVATMFKSVERVPQVKVLANVWSSNDHGNVSITHVRKLSDCNKIALSNQYLYTPTHEAIKYSARELCNVRGKKLLIILTDGHPQYHNKEGYPFSNDVLVDRCVKEHRMAQKFVRNIMCINISDEYRSRENLQRIFKKGYVEFEGMDKVNDFVLKNFRRTVTQVLRR